MADTIRVLRVIEYVGPRSMVEDQVHRSLHGEKKLPNGVIIRAATVGGYPELVQNLPEVCVGCVHPPHPGHNCQQFLLGGAQCGCQYGLVEYVREAN